MKASLASFVWVMLWVTSAHAQTELFPKADSTDVNPDTRLRLTFSSPPPLGNTGKIRVYDASDDSLADELDLSIPPGPRNTRTPAPYDTLMYSSIPDTVFTVSNPDTDTSHVYQKNYVGGMAEANARHFFPVLIEANVATIALHNGRLAYNKHYYVQIDASAFPFKDNSFAGITGKTAWTFATKAAPPAADAARVVVASDGSADFSTVQAAIDFIPDNSATPREIFIRNGVYEEIVALRNKQNLTLHGEDRSKVIVRYANNGVFNATGRSEFTLSTSTAVNLVNFTIQSVGKDENPAQAEALYVKGDKLQVHDVTMLGSGDAMQIQTNTRVYLSRSSVRGYGDNLLSYGAAFFNNCELISTYGPHGWPRNPSTNHGDVFLHSTFSLDGVGTSGDGHCSLARSPSSGSGGSTFPYAEFVLISCKLQGIIPEGWGAAGPDYANVHFWEYDSVNLSDGKPVDVSQRVSYSKQLTMEKDAETIANYSNPTYVLAGWTPELAPIILTQLPDMLAVPVGGSAELSTDAAAEPEPSYQWLKDGQPLPGETHSTLTLSSVTTAAAGEYTVSIQNSVGSTVSTKTILIVGGQPGGAGSSAQAGMGGAAGVAAITGGAGSKAQAGSAAGMAATTPPAQGSGGMAAAAAPSSGGAAGSVATSAGDNHAASPTRSSGGCSIGAENEVQTWGPVLLSALVMLRRRGRRLS